MRQSHAGRIGIQGIGLVIALGLLGAGPADEPDSKRPVVADASLVPSKGQAGSPWTLVIRVRLAPGWHIYAADRPTGGSIPTTLKLKLPEGVQARDDWEYPGPIPDPLGQGWVYEGRELTFRRTLAVAPGVAAGPIQVGCEFGYQACDASSCRPPARINLQAKAEPAARRTRP